MGDYYKIAEKNNGYVVIDVINEEGSFTPYPAFGLACDTYKCNINILL
jgi:hypothetical protein